MDLARTARVNYIGGSATVICDERVIGLKEIKIRVHEGGYH